MRSALHLLICCLVVLLAAACRGEGSDGAAAADKEEIETMLREYLPRLGKAYGDRHPDLLAGYAVPKEIARIDLRIQELAAAGQIYEPEFKEVTVEDVSVWNYSNAFVTTLEVWDVRSYPIGSRTVLKQSLDQRNRVKYQLKRKDDRWVVLYRELDQSFDS